MVAAVLADSAASTARSAAYAAWGSVITSAVALAFGYMSIRRTFHDRRTAQAEQITAWWTHVEAGTGNDLDLGDSIDPEPPAEDGYRAWLSNSSNDAVYGCMVFAEITPAPELTELTEHGNAVVGRPYMVLHEHLAAIAHGTVPPGAKVRRRLDPALVKSVGLLTIEFTDSRGVHWRRSAGKLTEGWTDDHRWWRRIRRFCRAVFP